MKDTPRRICFVTGTRAEFGLMESTLRAIQKHPKLKLQIIATGMHLDPAYGKPLSAIREAGFKVNETVAWGDSPQAPFLTALRTGLASALMPLHFQNLKPHIILLVGDRVEVFAAAAAAHISQIPIAHIHGGDRALGQIDDSLRHAITKLSHIHFPATRHSAQRIRKLGEDPWRIKFVGSPAIDIIGNLEPWNKVQEQLKGLQPHRYALVIMHPTTSDPRIEMQTARMISLAIAEVEFDAAIYVYPNNDPGSDGIIQYLDGLEEHLERHLDNQYFAAFFRNMPRPLYLTCLKNAAVLIGNSSSGIIEAASFGTPVINIGDRQKGRERNKNVIDVPANAAAIRRALKKVWNNGHPIRFPRHNIYGSGRTSQKIAHILATIPLDERLRRKLIAY